MTHTHTHTHALHAMFHFIDDCFGHEQKPLHWLCSFFVIVIIRCSVLFGPCRPKSSLSHVSFSHVKRLLFSSQTIFAMFGPVAAEVV